MTDVKIVLLGDPSSDAQRERCESELASLLDQGYVLAHAGVDSGGVEPGIWSAMIYTLVREETAGAESKVEVSSGSGTGTITDEYTGGRSVPWPVEGDVQDIGSGTVIDWRHVPTEVTFPPSKLGVTPPIDDRLPPTPNNEERP